MLSWIQAESGQEHGFPLCQGPTCCQETQSHTTDGAAAHGRGCSLGKTRQLVKKEKRNESEGVTSFLFPSGIYFLQSSGTVKISYAKEETNKSLKQGIVYQS